MILLVFHKQRDGMCISLRVPMKTTTLASRERLNSLQLAEKENTEEFKQPVRIEYVKSVTGDRRASARRRKASHWQSPTTLLSVDTYILCWSPNNCISRRVLSSTMLPTARRYRQRNHQHQRMAYRHEAILQRCCSGELLGVASPRTECLLS